MSNVTETLKNNQMSKEEREQYLFGPWLSEITTKENIPIQYMTYKDLILSADFAIKVPVNRDRNELDPGMLMYKQLILFTTEEIILLETSSRGIIESKLLYHNIKYIIRGGELLNNYILIGIDDIEYKIEYYSISEEITSRMIQFIRHVFQAEVTSVDSFSLDNKKLIQIPLYKYFKIKNDSNIPMKIVGYQPEKYVKIINPPNRNSILNRAKQVMIDEVLFLTNGKELIIASGDINKSKQATVDYSYRHCYIRIDYINNIKLSKDVVLEDTHMLTLDIDGLFLSLDVKEGFDTTLLIGLINKNDV